MVLPRCDKSYDRFYFSTRQPCLFFGGTLAAPLHYQTAPVQMTDDFFAHSLGLTWKNQVDPPQFP